MAATIEVEQPAIPLPYTENPHVYNIGSPDKAVLKFEIPAGKPGATGPTGPTGPAGETAAIIPFSLSKYGVHLATDEWGNPSLIAFSGFGGGREEDQYLQEGEWATGTITVNEIMYYGTAFIMPRNGLLKNIYAFFALEDYDHSFSDDSTIRPFVCLAVSNSDDLVYNILQNTITFTEPYAGGAEYPRHTSRRGSLTNLDIEIPEGALVRIVAGIMGENIIEEQYGTFAICGGLYLE